MKKILLIILLSLASFQIFASHIVGGEVFYTYIGPGTSPGESKYTVSIRLFADCNVPCGGNTGVACLPNEVVIGIFTNASPYKRFRNYSMSLTNTQEISLSTY